jgi:hypothetical protein
MVRYFVVAGVLGALVVVGCSSADIEGTPLVGERPEPKPAPASGGEQCTDTSNIQPANPADFPSCCDDGAAHCVPSNRVPSSFTSVLKACTGGLCVPDPYIKQPTMKPPTCKAFDGSAGACVSVCVPQVAQYKDILKQDTCGGDEKCVPCISPLDKKPTGVCNLGGGSSSNCKDGGGGVGPASDGGGGALKCPHVGPPVIDPSTLPACGDAGGAHCLNASLVPPAMASQLKACPTGLCVPDTFIAAGGQFIPPTCKSINDAEGRCLHVAIPQVESQKGQLPQATCATFERCVPCFNPLDAKDTGACKQSCDPGPKEPPKQLKDCCVEDNVAVGKCVPTSSIEDKMEKNLDQDVCTEGAELCVPKDFLTPNYKPQACNANSLLIGAYTGVCLSDCLKFGIQGIALSRGNCPSDYKCAPCTRNGQPTGAPGCPP